MVNKPGGVKIGNDTYKIELISEDSKGSAEGASTAASKLVTQDKVEFVLGAMLEEEMAAINEVTEPAGVLYATGEHQHPGSRQQDVSADKTSPVRPFINHDDNQPIDLDYLRKTYPKAKKIAVSAPDIGYEGMIEHADGASDRPRDGGSSGGEVALGHHGLRPDDDQSSTRRSPTSSGRWSAGRRTTS